MLELYFLASVEARKHDRKRQAKNMFHYTNGQTYEGYLSTQFTKSTGEH